MLRFHTERLILAALVLAPLIAGGLIVGGGEAGQSQVRAERIEVGAMIEQVSEQLGDKDSARRSDVGPARSAELRWSFFSFGRRGTF